MSVLIKGMKMPKDCQFCAFSYEDEDTEIYCNALHRYLCETGKECPLVEVPEPHGRLIDADALNLDYEVNMADDWKTAHEIANCVRYAPTVIEAEGQENDS